jgi:hypothetical protein
MRMKKLLMCIGLLALMGAASAMDEYKAGDNITIRSMYADNGVPTTGAVCLLNLWSQTDNILTNAGMTDSGDGFYNYTITGWLTTDNITKYDGFVFCSKDGVSGSTSFNFMLVRNTEEEWSSTINQSISESNTILRSLNDTASAINASIGKSNDYLDSLNSTITGISGTVNNITSSISTSNSILDRIYLLLFDTFNVEFKDTQHYNIQITTGTTFNNIIADRFTPSSNFGLDNVQLANGTYTTRVRIYDATLKRYGGWSVPVTFTVTNSTV